MTRLHFNPGSLVDLPRSSLDGAMNNSTTTMTLASPLLSGNGSTPDIDSPDYLVVQVDDEIIWITGLLSGELEATVVRGREGTAAAAHDDGSAAVCTFTAVDVQPHEARFTRNSDQTISDGTATSVIWNHTDSDLFGMLDGGDESKINLPEGLWHVTAVASYHGAATASARLTILEVDGSLKIDQDLSYSIPNALIGTSVGLGGWVKSDGSTYVQLIVFHLNGSNLAVGNYDDTYIRIVKVG